MISKILEAQRHSATGEAAPTAREPRVEPLRQPLAPRPKRRGWTGLLGWLVFAAIAGAAYYYVPLETWKSLLTKVLPAPAPPPQVKGPKVVPVVVSAARLGDMDIYLNGLGTVTALYTVTLHTRVDGELIHVGFTEGQMVKKGDLLAEIDPRPFQVQLTQGQGTLMKDEAALKIAQLDMDRYNRLLASKSVTQQQVDAQIALVKQAEGAIKTDQGLIDNTQLQLKYCRITAPISGRIGLRMVDPGNIIHASDLTGLAVITQLQPITVVFTIPQDDIARVQKRVNTGEPVEVEAYDRDFRTHLATGMLMALDNQVDATTGTVRLKAKFDNHDNLLFPNQFVNCRLLIGSQRDVVIIPTASVQHGPESTFVYVVEEGSDAEKTVALRKVTVGPTEGDQVVIASGLAPGDAVVVDGIDKLQPGTKVAVRGASAGANAKADADRGPSDQRGPAADRAPAENRSHSQTSP
ncbi:MAG TPA: MdtA/MuxA family multidrug efflux RND transporter periplasmic adaptor subunit [Pirellulales bacterium]|jgi:multidrug efflux system membrane fusion protein|nr:MdtA/MuxA family multidrug efflux RND transporter periplasmic adaptor subunit [Pirellulales bacterium]